jgi:transposase
MRKKGSLESWQLRRNIAVDMHEQGHKSPAIAAALGVSPRSVQQWIALSRREGREALASKKPTGRKARLNEQQKARLRELLVLTPQQQGFEGRHLWTQQLIADLILREFAVRYHHDRICRILKQIGFSHQKPARRAKERDELKIQAWRQETWPALLKKAPLPAG